jgi:hypothetical protein
MMIFIVVNDGDDDMWSDVMMKWYIWRWWWNDEDDVESDIANYSDDIWYW